MAALELPTLNAGHCVLRPWTLDDAAALRESCGDEDICRFTTVPRVYSYDGAARWIRRQLEHGTAGIAVVMAIVAAGDQQPVGMVGLFGLHRPERTARFGYWLIARSRRRGLATSAARVLGGWAFASLALEAIFIDCEPTNLASARVAAHLGATLAGSRWVRANGLEVELDRYVLTRPSA
jgi:[ribosomal protein S5]-alanine N-acetyltransferase